MTNAPPSYSRFHAIISATPGSGIPPRPAPYPTQQTPRQSSSSKRRRIDDSAVTFSRALRDATKNESTASRQASTRSSLTRIPLGLTSSTTFQRPSKFATKDLMLESLKQSFKTSQTVDFHGSYELVEAGITHKQRVQSLTVDIWRATGYRFTCVSIHS